MRKKKKSRGIWRIFHGQEAENLRVVMKTPWLTIAQTNYFQRAKERSNEGPCSKTQLFRVTYANNGPKYLYYLGF